MYFWLKECTDSNSYMQCIWFSRNSFSLKMRNRIRHQIIYISSILILVPTAHILFFRFHYCLLPTATSEKCERLLTNLLALCSHNYLEYCLLHIEQQQKLYLCWWCMTNYSFTACKTIEQISSKRNKDHWDIILKVKLSLMRDEVNWKRIACNDDIKFQC